MSERPVVVLPDVESIVVQYLKANTEVAAICGGRVHGSLPPKVTLPAVSVLLVSDNVPIEFRLTGAWLQVDCWSDVREQARTLARTALAHLLDMRGVQPDGSVVSSVGVLNGVRQIGDEAHSRYSFEVRVHAHP